MPHRALDPFGAEVQVTAHVAQSELTWAGSRGGFLVKGAADYRRPGHGLRTPRAGRLLHQTAGTRWRAARWQPVTGKRTGVAARGRLSPPLWAMAGQLRRRRTSAARSFTGSRMLASRLPWRRQAASATSHRPRPAPNDFCYEFTQPQSSGLDGPMASESAAEMVLDGRRVLALPRGHRPESCQDEHHCFGLTKGQPARSCSHPSLRRRRAGPYTPPCAWVASASAGTACRAGSATKGDCAGSSAGLVAAPGGWPAARWRRQR